MLQRCYISNSFFYKKVHQFAPNAAAMFHSVASWIDGVDFLKKEFIIIPVHDALHWSVAIIVNNPRDSPFLIHLDSHSVHDTGAIADTLQLVRSFLIPKKVGLTLVLNPKPLFSS